MSQKVLGPEPAGGPFGSCCWLRCICVLGRATDVPAAGGVCLGCSAVQHISKVCAEWKLGLQYRCCHMASHRFPRSSFLDRWCTPSTASIRTSCCSRRQDMHNGASDVLDLPQMQNLPAKAVAGQATITPVQIRMSRADINFRFGEVGAGWSGVSTLPEQKQALLEDSLDKTLTEKWLRCSGDSYAWGCAGPPNYPEACAGQPWQCSCQVQPRGCMDTREMAHCCVQGFPNDRLSPREAPLHPP